jgi:NAD(P)-dependent dehydrogenase (short-subunit alcohol dehydrogenase family)
MKTAAREWPKVACRAIDVDPALSVDAAAAMLAKELGYEGPVETALSSAGARTVALNDQAAISGPDPLSAGDVVIVTGGARGVTAACARALAREFKPRLVLVGRSPAPEAEDAGLKGARTEAELRRALSAAHPGLAPKEIAARAKAALAAREIRATLDELGSAARYESCDARDESAVKALIAKVEAELGPVRGLVHGAGVLADKALVEKTPEQFDVVLETKLSGLRHFLNSLELSRLKLLSLFSSSTARHGRVGQSDYAVANEALNKIGQALAARLPSCRVNSVGWGPWDGGMVDAGLAKMFSAEGVGLIGLRAGAEHLIAETRGADVESTAVAQADSAPADTAEAFERALTLEDSPILKSHVFGGRAVAPLALSAEWLAHAALHGNPGMKFLGFDDLRVIAPIAVRPGEATTISVRAAAALKRDGLWVVPAEIRGGDGGVRVSARVVLGTQWAKAPTAKVPVSGEAYCGGLEKAYGRVLFHGPELRVITDLPVMSPEGFVAISAPTPSPSLWMKRPLRDRWIADPAALDAAFQAAILWTQENMGAPSLPSFAARYRQFAEAFPEGGVRISARVLVRGSVASADVDFLDERGALVARLEGFESTAHESLASAFRDR